VPLWVRRDQLQADLLDQARRRWDTLLQPAREQFARLQQLEQTQAAWRQRMQPVYDSLAALNQQTPGTDLMQGIQGIGGVGDTLGRAGAGLQDLNRQQPGTGLLEQMQPQVTRAGQDLDALGQRGSMLITPLADIGRRALGTLGQAGQVAGAVGEFNPVEAGSRAGLATRQGLSELGPTPAGQYLQQPLAGVRKAYTDTGAQVERTRREAQQATRPLLGETGSQVAGLGAAGLSALPVFAGELGAQSARRAFGGTPLEEPMVGLTRGLGQASGVGFGVGGVE
jgi:hypothetical protein